MNKPTENVIDDLDAGVFAQKVQSAFASVALGVSSTRRKGKVTLTFDLKAIGDSNQIEMSHQVKFVKPTLKGRVIEENTTSTPLHVGNTGALTLFPDTQQPLFKRENENA